MTDDRLDDLLSIWQQAQESGRTITPDELCRECPELLAQVAQRIEFLRRMDRMAGSGDTPSFNDEPSTQDETYVVPDSGSVRPTEVVKPLGKSIGPYELLSEIARGGMGVVYKARHHKLGRLAAVKMILGAQFASQEQVRRFYTEAEAAALLDHPGIVPVFEVGEHEGQHFLAMAFIDGQSLSQRLKDSPLEPRAAAQMMKQIAEALHHAHTQGIVHRDLKPQNILITREGQPRVTDFGLAKLMSDDSSLTASGQVMGTPSYMPPEQALGRLDQVGVLSDVYSLGATLYCMLTGRPPFQSATVTETLRQVCEVEPVAPRLVNPAIDRDLETICLKCLQKDPARRYASAQALALDINRYLNGEPIVARSVSTVERVWRWTRKRPLAAALILAAFALPLLSVIGLWYREQYLAKTQQLDAAERLRKVSEFHAIMSRTREIASNPVQGWTWKATQELSQARGLIPTPEDALAWEATSAQVLTHPDMRPLGKIGKNFDIGAMAFSPDGKKLAIGIFKHITHLTVEIYSVADGKLLRTLSAVSAGTSLANLWSLKTKFQEGVSSIAWSPDENWLAAGTRSGKLVHWDLRQAQPAGVLQDAHQVDLKFIAFAANGRFLISGGETYKYWSVPEWKVIQTVHDRIKSFHVSPDGTRAAFGLEADDRIEIHALQSGNPDEPINTIINWIHSTLPHFSPDGRWLATLDSDGGNWLSIRDATTGDTIHSWRAEVSDGAIYVQRLAFLANGAILVTNDRNGRYHFWDSTSGRQVLPPMQAGNAFATHPVLNSLAIESKVTPRKADLFETRWPESVVSLQHPGLIGGFDFSPDGKRMSVVSRLYEDGSDAKRPRVVQRTDWDLEQKRPVLGGLITTRNRFPLWNKNVLAWHPTQQQVAWFTELLGLMVSPVNGQPGHDRMVSNPPLPPPEDIDVAELLSIPETRGAQLVESNSQPKAKAVAFVDSPVEGGPRIAFPINKFRKIDRNQRLAIAFKVAASGPVNAELDVGWFNTEKLDESSVDRFRLRDVPPDQGVWYVTAVLDWQNIVGQDGRNRFMRLAIPDGITQRPKVQVQRFATAHYLPVKAQSDKPIPLNVGAVAWSPDGRRLWGLIDGEEQLVSWDGDSLQVAGVWDIRNAKLLTNAAWITSLAAGNRRVLCGSGSGTLNIFRTDKQKLEPDVVINVNSGDILSLALSQDENWAVLATATGRTEIRDLNRQAILSVIPDTTLPVRSIALGNQDRLLVTACDDGFVRLYYVDDPEHVRPWIKFRSRAAAFNRIRLSRDGTKLAAAAVDSTSVTIWDLAQIQAQLGHSESLVANP